MMAKRPATARAILVAALVTGGVVAGCISNPATSQGREMADLYRVFVIVGVVIAAIVWSVATWSILRYRRRSDALPRQTEGNTRVEIIWTVLPLLTVLILFGLTVRALTAVEATGAGGIDLQVTAFRWQWSVAYPGSNVSIVGTPDAPLEIVLPVGEPVHVTLASTDVAHAFYVPAFLFKRDAIPGRPTTFDLNIEKAGVYDGHCAEFCGNFHDEMLFTIRALAPDEFRSWLASQAAGATP